MAFRLALGRFQSSVCKTTEKFPEVAVDETQAPEVTLRLKPDS